MTLSTSLPPAPLLIGATGGSGTRLVKAFLEPRLFGGTRVNPASFNRKNLTIAFLLLVLPSLRALPAQAADVEFDLRIERGRVPADMRVIRVKQGDNVTLRWSTDRAIVVHLHGYDIEKKLEAGTIADMTFHARATGRFPVEIHASKAGAAGHAHGEMPLVQIEVHPR